MDYQFIELDLTEEEKEYSRPLWHDYFFMNSEKIKLGGEVKKYLEINGKLLILMEDYYLKDRNRNIWCFNEEGEKVWEIESCYDTPELQNPDTVVRSASPYTSITIYNGVVRVFNWSGNLGELDLETGKVSHWEFVG